MLALDLIVIPIAICAMYFVYRIGQWVGVHDFSICFLAFFVIGIIRRLIDIITSMGVMISKPDIATIDDSFLFVTAIIISAGFILLYRTVKDLVVK